MLGLRRDDESMRGIASSSLRDLTSPVPSANVTVLVNKGTKERQGPLLFLKARGILRRLWVGAKGCLVLAPETITFLTLECSRNTDTFRW